MQRVVVVGSSCAGKTHFSQQLAQRIQADHIQLDALHWGPDWTPCAADEFRQSVEEATGGERWIVDGNYVHVREIVWKRADALVWLDYSFARVMARACWRTIGRVLSGAEIYSGNRESFRRSFCSRDSILLWVATSHKWRRSEMARLLDEQQFENLVVHRLPSPRGASRFLANLDQT